MGYNNLSKNPIPIPAYSTALLVGRIDSVGAKQRFPKLLTHPLDK